jgi:hypothetical protein
MTEFDLAARLNKTIRKDLAQGVYEIVDIGSYEVSHSRPTLKEIVRVANSLGDRIKVECDGACPKNPRVSR